VFGAVLIANRGEIARRIIRACRALGIRAIAVYSEADAKAAHVAEADEAVPIGAAPAKESYLDGARIIQAALVSGAEAIHPGYGFLSEDWRFAEACAAAGLTFVGPSADAIRRMGDKTEARRLMTAAGVPVVPGSTEPVKDAAEAERVAREIGFPVILKAAHGGGGIGMARVAEPGAVAAAFATAERRAQAAFGGGAIYVERYLEQPRHVEVQVFGDTHGTLVHLHERECSIQRRHQKLVEESPAPNLSSATKAGLTAAAVKGARAIGYVNAGTLEFLVEPAGRFYFLEMNTRLQVEHAVTEEVTGLDLVAAQLRVAAGEPLPWPPEQIRVRGAAVECRIYAEDPARDFLPSPGPITAVEWPQGPGIRIEAGVAAGGEVPVHYDPLIAKIIASGRTRHEAVARMARALEACRIEGVKTTLPFLARVIGSEAFRAGAVHTQMVEQGAFHA
jgi:acetyl-CoA carboxylase biotin carboxylase subunit